MKCEGGSMSWMDSGMKMSTEGGGGIGKALGRAFSGESIFLTIMRQCKMSLKSLLQACSLEQLFLLL